VPAHAARVSARDDHLSVAPGCPNRLVDALYRTLPYEPDRRVPKRHHRQRRPRQHVSRRVARPRAFVCACRCRARRTSIAPTSPFPAAPSTATPKNRDLDAEPVDRLVAQERRDDLRAALDDQRTYVRRGPAGSRAHIVSKTRRAATSRGAPHGIADWRPPPALAARPRRCGLGAYDELTVRLAPSTPARPLCGKIACSAKTHATDASPGASTRTAASIVELLHRARADHTASLPARSVTLTLPTLALY